ncbi:putative PKS-like enzyme [Aspergillus sclerotiicarbonarius CBS 121057]|uniref:Putative PKS-like enzyme n=1 Tax=Aspergillus sclerotiicarbonarius (strain CBS 121057 / IBT 28362) TaxID=1448318 RepID=A0A319EBZ9_ASPSB|nr:putative PKS-like enzyme [Aspergillus sclerotiicarbonarius CBS 121057]
MSSPFTAQPLTVVGMACRLPGNSNNPTALWQFLERGGIARNEPPASRFHLPGHEDGSKRPKTMRSPGGMFLENIDPADIDAQFFGLSRSEATAMDPQQRQLLEVVYEGLENAGITLESLKGRPVGCFVGSYASDYADIQARDPEDRVPSTTVGIGRAMLSNRLSHFLDIKGPSMTIDTACSGSLVGLDVAARYLQTGEINAAIVAGCNLYMSPEHCIDMSNLNGAASLSGRCHTFDAKADGYIKSEAVNMVFIKRLPDALRDGDPIRAIIRGSASNSDGWTAGIASPSSSAQATATRQAYINAGITDLNSTTYVECHGTGTRAGDPIEVNSVASVFCETRSPDHPLLIGSIKSNLGHSEPAAGISGLIKAILALENGIIPGNPTFETPNPAIDFDALKIRAFQRAIPWPNVPFRRASVNSFGYGGSNVHVILDEPKTAVSPADVSFASSYMTEEDDPFADEEEEKPHLLVFSANDEASLRAYIQSLQTHLINPRVRIALPDLAYTLSERRTRHFHRGYLVSNTSSLDPHSLVLGKLRPNAPRVGFVFTGQDELTSPRSAEHVRQPEFSQPLVTALQLVMLDILQTWGVHPSSVVGHSSGEIAASVAAGYLTPEEAIQVAYYRGKAAVDLQDSARPKLGMLAAGLGQDSPLLQELLQANSQSIAVACVNSPESVTLSGYTSALEQVGKTLKDHGHFARLLQVDLAYHSEFMADIAAHYKHLLDTSLISSTSPQSSVKMFSSVTGAEMNSPCDANYWRANMESPVLFSQAVQTMLTDDQPADFLIELGPSGALAGPVKQILKPLQARGTGIEYHAACKRGSTAAMALFDVAGHLFVSGGSVDVARVNAHTQTSNPKPSLIVDLPNYSWNHSTKYWYESKASKDWRFRKYPNHDLLGGKVLGTSWLAPAWKKVLRLPEITWLQDHRIGGQVLFPAAGYIAMAIEAVYQMGQSRGFIDPSLKVHEVPYRLRNVSFNRAMVLEGAEQRIMLTLTPEDDREDGWSRFSVLMLHDDDSSTSHCSGLIALHKSIEEVAPPEHVKPLEYPSPAQAWYKALGDVGYAFGPSFQSQLEVEAVAGSRRNRGCVSFVDPPSAFPQSPYSIHPVAIDGCLQSGAPSLWQGIRSAVGGALVPAVIEDLVINARHSPVETGISVASAEHSGVGSRDEAHNYKSHITVYDSATQRLMIQIRGLWYHKLDAQDDSGSEHTYMQLDWKPDITSLSQEQLCELFNAGKTEATLSPIELLVHKKPNLKVVEFNMLPSAESVWLNSLDAKSPIIKGGVQHSLITKDAASLLASQGSVGNVSNVHMSMLDVTRPAVDMSALREMDLAVLRVGQLSNAELANAVTNATAVLREGGYLLFVGSQADPATLCDTPSPSDSESERAIAGERASFVSRLLREHDFEKIVPLVLKNKALNPFDFAVLSQRSHATAVQASPNRPDAKRRKVIAEPKVDLVRLSASSGVDATIREQLTSSGIRVTEHSLPLPSLRKDSVVLIVDELFSPVLATVTPSQWDAIHQIVATECKILWVTSGSQLQVTNPHNAMVYGMSRVIRAEDPSVSFTVLDVESVTSPKSLQAITQMVLALDSPKPGFHDTPDYEFVEQGGIVHVSRVYPNSVLNTSEKDASSGGKPITQHLHDHPSCVRMVCQRPGMLESLCFTEVSTEDIPLPEDFVEVDMHAAGLNYKDVATSLGIVPENQYLLGFEGAGVIRRVGKRATSFHIGQRVVVYRRGGFGNKVQAPVQGVYPIPDWMSYEEAATLPVVYHSVIYGLFDLANMQRGQSVLIHSATGGVGIAAIQVCQYMGAEIYATVGNDQKRAFLTETFNIPASRIYSSRNADFATRILKETGGRGADIVLNSLTGKLLDESWRIVAACGTMVELGKKDILARNSLSMEPFNRNASYRAIDMSHYSITRPTTARLMKQMFDLINGGHIRPIEQRTVFPYSDIAGAIRYMRGGAHIGKIIISRDAAQSNPEVPIIPAQKELRLRDDISYLIVGGLKGVCGSLAVYLARHGAKHLTVMSRSGYADAKSQSIVRDLSALGTQCDLVQGDVSIQDDVRRAFRQASKPIGGIIQGAMVLQDKVYTRMTVDEFHTPLQCKIAGTWNLHSTAAELNLPLDFFTLLSSSSGVVGQKGQANYAAANAFLDSFALYRRAQNLPVCAVDLGVIEDVGYISERQSIATRLDANIWTPINEGLLHRILRVSILQGEAQLITGIPYPQPAGAVLLNDARFTPLLQTGDASDAEAGDHSRDVQALLGLVRAAADRSDQLAATIEVVNRHFMRSLGLAEPMEPAKPLAVYGLDSLAAVDFRNWVRQELKVAVSTLEVVGAKTLSALCERILDKLVEN